MRFETADPLMETIVDTMETTKEENNVPAAFQPPTEWPLEATRDYEPLRTLGQGRFAVVVLARHKNHALCAMKSVWHTLKRDAAYAQREIEILSALDHPNVMRLLHHWVHENKQSTLMALSYAKGLTLQSILERRGCLRLRFARTICAQLVDTVEYLHGHAVCHRDIKPDNIIVAQDDEGDVNDNSYPVEDEEWSLCREKWKITIIDFGLARALTPNDIKEHHESIRTVKPTGPDSSIHTQPGLSSSSHSNSSRKAIRRSMSRRFQRKMSAVGNRNYAAPEIVNHVRESSHHPIFMSGHPVDVMETLADNVASYGLMVDSFSVGKVIQYCLTGCSPHERVEDAIAFANHPVSLLCRLVCGGGQQQIRYRSTSDVPGEVLRLMRGLTHPNPQERTTMRAARTYPWIDGALPEFVPPGEIQYLHLGEQRAQEESKPVIEAEEGEM